MSVDVASSVVFFVIAFLLPAVWVLILFNWREK